VRGTLYLPPPNNIKPHRRRPFDVIIAVLKFAAVDVLECFVLTCSKQFFQLDKAHTRIARSRGFALGFTDLIPLFHWAMSLNPVVTAGLLKISGLFAVWDFMAK